MWKRERKRKRANRRQTDISFIANVLVQFEPTATKMSSKKLYDEIVLTNGNGRQQNNICDQVLVATFYWYGMPMYVSTHQHNQPKLVACSWYKKVETILECVRGKERERERERRIISDMDLSYDWADEFTCIYKLSHVSNDDDKFKGMDLARSIRYQPTVSKDIRVFICDKKNILKWMQIHSHTHAPGRNNQYIKIGWKWLNIVQQFKFQSLGLVFIKGQRLKDIGPSHIKKRQ